MNLVGCFLLGVVVALAAQVQARRYLRPLLGTGLCGGLTTFSAVSLVSVQLIGDGRYALAGAYLTATVVGGLAAAALGLGLMRAVGLPCRAQGAG